VIPPFRDVVVIDGSTVMIMLRALESLPAELVALAVRLNVPVAVGVPEITPVVVFKLKPVGSLPPEIDQVIGFVPVALSVSL
jgi:hypothetical protein